MPLVFDLDLQVYDILQNKIDMEQYCQMIQSVKNDYQDSFQALKLDVNNQLRVYDEQYFSKTQSLNG